MTLRVVLSAYTCLGVVLAADGRAWLALPFCMIALLAVGELWLRALSGPPVLPGPLLERGIPIARLGFAAVAGLATLPLVALGLHAAGAPVRLLPLTLGGAVTVTMLGAAAFFRARLRLPAQDDGDSGGLSGHARTAVAVTVPAVLVLAVGGVAVRAYLASPRPAEPGYLSVALNGWAAQIDRPVTVPARGLIVPVRVTSAGIDTTRTRLSLRIGGLVVATRPVTVAADTVQSMSVRVPALPADGCLHAVSISVGTTSTGFYARGPVAARPAAVRPAAVRPAAVRPAAARPAAVAGAFRGRTTC
ncbi:hypothetical protein [Actinoplanes sp. GCM10030250]|uniref:hypothetical protein n=1 Tax=Actinoplanes sp. GCM10030250 TaxID=3273376 RepID=UPI003615813A